MQKTFVRSFGTRSAPELRRPGPWSGKAPLSRNQLGKNRLPKTHGFLGRGEPLIQNYKRRWRGGRYNYFDWQTLRQCIDKCPSVIERDRMPSPQELNYFYRGAQIGVRHHGGFDVVAQILNLRPYRPYLIKAKEYPQWIEEQWIERKMSDDGDTRSPHKHSIPEYLRMDSKVKNIRGKTLTNNDKRRIVRKIYEKINVVNYESDVEKRNAIKYEYLRYKQQLRDNIVLEEDELGFAMDGIRRRNIDGSYVRNPLIESQKDAYDRKLFSANNEHILFSDSSHVDAEEKQFQQQKQSRRVKIKNKLRNLMRRKGKESDS